MIQMFLKAIADSPADDDTLRQDPRSRVRIADRQAPDLNEQGYA